MIYLLVCKSCDGDGRMLPIPFESPKARGEWASKHTNGTGHDSWIVWDREENADKSD